MSRAAREEKISSLFFPLERGMKLYSCHAFLDADKTFKIIKLELEFSFEDCYW